MYNSLGTAGVPSSTLLTPINKIHIIFSAIIWRQTTSICCRDISIELCSNCRSFLTGKHCLSSFAYREYNVILCVISVSFHPFLPRHSLPYSSKILTFSSFWISLLSPTFDVYDNICSAIILHHLMNTCTYSTYSYV